MRNGLLISISGIILISLAFSVSLLAGSPAQDLQSGVQKKDSEKVKKAVEELVLQNDVKACSALLDALTPPPETGIYWIIIEGISRLSNSDAISRLTTYILSNKSKDIGRDLLGAMKNNRSPNILPLLKDVLEKAQEDMKIECLHQLGGIQTKESLEVLFNFLGTLDEKDNKDKGLIKEAIVALKRITGIDKGNYTASWLDWWKENKDKQIGDIIKPKTVAGGSIDNVSQYRDMTGVEDLPKEKVIVVRNDICDENIKKSTGNKFDGNFDRIQDILTRLGIAHTVIGKSELEKDSFDWNDKWTIIFNCNFFKEHCCNPEHLSMPPTGIKGNVERTQGCPGQNKHMNHSSKLSKKTIEKIRKFVETGGYLFTEDLNIEEIIEPAFKGIITHTKYLPERTVQIVPAPGATLHPYLKYVFEAPPSSDAPAMPSSEGKSGETQSVKPGEFRLDAEWKIDNESPDIKVLKKDIVTVLIMSPKLANAKSKDEGAVAVTWGVSGENIVSTGSNKTSYAGGGRVMHVMSHFGKQKSKIDEFALQNLLLNFLIELNQRRPKGKK